ncbi:MAG: flavodoxin family protein [Candidatus Cryosericum sp.]
MNVRVIYQSTTGNTKRVADAMAAATGRAAEPVADAVISEPVDMLFLGGAIHGGDIDPSVKTFIEGLDSALVKQVTVFSTGFEQDKGKAIGIMKDLLSRRGIAVTNKCYFCRGKFLLFGRGHPDTEDLAGAEEFARSVLTD